MADDYRNTVTGSGILGSIATGGVASGNIEIRGDRDVFAITLIEGLTYTFEQRGSEGSLDDAYLYFLSASGTLLSNNDDSNSLDSMIVYAADATDTYFLQAAGYSSHTGTYNLYSSAGMGSFGNDYIEGSGVADAIDGNQGNDTILGGDGADSLYGGVGTGADSLDGGNGADYMTGGDGNDALNGGAGLDTMIGGRGNDTYYVDATGDVVTEAFTGTTGGTDTVYANASFTLGANVENLYLFDTGSINATGNDGANDISGTIGANYLRGMGGADILRAGSGNDSLDGGTGADAMTGGAGDDTYYVDNAGDTISEVLTGTAGGADRVYATVGHTLATNVEDLYLVGTTAANGTGNALNNAISGNSYVNTLRGLGGNDTFQSGNGADVLIGGTGNDTFRFSGTTGSNPSARDVIRGGDGAIAFEKAGAALGDRIDLSAIDANTSASGTQHFVFGTSHGAGRLWTSTSGSMTLINGNTDGDSTIEFQIAIDDGSVSASAYTGADFIL